MTVQILIDGTDYAPHVEYAGARFTARVNGAVGDCVFAIKDVDRAFSFHFGQEIALVVDGTTVWGGWMLAPQRTYPMPVMPRPVAQPVLWAISGVDYNRVFDFRVVHDLAHPAKEWSYAAGSWDDDVINDVWSYFDMTGFTKDIHRVGHAVLDIAGVSSRDGGLIASGGYSLRDVLTSIIRNTAAIFFCTPGKVVTYVDSDTQTATYFFTDTPSIPGGGLDPVAYRHAKIADDMTDMRNEAFVWGAGYGSQNVVYSHLRSDSSVAAHGLWQVGKFTGGVYKQASADAISSSYVNGSPDAHRGGKYPKRSVVLTSFDPRIRVGDVVTFHCSSFLLPTDPPSHDDTLPIRQLTVTFPTPSTPRFDAMLSWEIDAEWSFFDPWVPPPAGRIPKPGGGGTGVIDSGGCTDDICGITDTFARTTSQGAASSAPTYPDAEGWGMADCELVWNHSGGDNYAQPYLQDTWVDGSAGVHYIEDGNYFSFQSLHWGYDLFADGPLDVRTEFNVDKSFAPGAVPNSDPGETFGVFLGWASGHGGSVYTEIGRLTGGLYLYMQGNDDPTFTEDYVFIPIDETQPFTMHWTCAGPGSPVYCTVWQSSGSEPGSPTLSIPSWSGNWLFDRFDNQLRTTLSYPPGTPFHGYMNYLDVHGLNKCSAVQFDDFNRVRPSGWGNATPSGTAWSVYAASAGTASSVDGSNGILSLPTGSGNSVDMASTPVGVASSSWMLTARIPQITPGVVDYGLYVTGSGLARIAIYAAAGYVYGTDNVHVPFTFDGSSYLVRWQFAAGAADNFRIWREQDPEPSAWTHANSTTYLSPGANTLHATATNRDAANPHDAAYDWIDLDYTDRPCYYDCFSFSDDFDRAVGDCTGIAGWGNGWDDADLRWVDVTCVDGSAARYSTADYGDGGAWGNSHAVSVPLAAGAVIRASFSSFDIVGANSLWIRLGNVSDSIQVTFYPDPYSTDDLVDVSIHVGGVGGTASVSVGSHADPSFGDWTSGTGISLAVDYDGSSISVSAVYEGTTYDLGPVAVGTPSGPWTSVTVGGGGGGAANSFAIDSVSVGGPSCTPVDPISASTSVTGARVFEAISCMATPVIVDSVPVYPSGSVWRTSIASYASGSEILIVNGIVQSGVVAETDPASGSLSISIDVPVSDTVMLSYLTNGALP